METQRLDTILEKHHHDPAALLAILQDIQKDANYLPRESLQQVAADLSIATSRVYAMATFFSSFSLKPRGKHVCTVCMGTACHVRGAPKLVDHVGREHGVRPGETSADGHLTLETVNCVGACALGPLAIVDGEYHGNLTTKGLDKVLRGLKRGS
ncbi:MAG TPA: NAD(P)H-dependent oxidoreductase subunit E [Polyangia bacterium]|jgi:NADH-quinone oxidoreductase subunit E